MPNKWEDFIDWGSSRLKRNRTWMLVIKISWSLYIHTIWNERNIRIKECRFSSVQMLLGRFEQDLKIKFQSLKWFVLADGLQLMPATAV